MNGDKKRVYFPTDVIAKAGNNNNMSFVQFRRKTESLDWKKIASIDVEKVIQSSNTEILDDLLSQVAYCRPESEFDSDSPSSGLLKVFKLSQLMIEYLLHCQEILQGQSEQVTTQFTQVENQRLAYVNEIQSLKENLSAAKRELKRRKEIIATAQNEVIGDNKDEFDPCPYCSKKFLTSAYLYSHMLRRHQGLPIQPVFPAQSIYQGLTPKFIDNSYQKQQQQQYIEQPRSPRQRNTSGNYFVQPTESQDDRQEDKMGVVDVEKLVNLETIGALVEQCLQQKGIKNQPSMTNSTTETLNSNVRMKDQNVNTDIVSPSLVSISTSKDVEEVKKIQEKFDPNETVNKISEQIKNQLNTQWRQLLDKIKESGLADIKASEPGEIDSKSITPSPTKSPVKMTQTEMIEDLERSSPNVTVEENKKSSPTLVNHQQLVQELRQQQYQQHYELESLKSNLQTRMEKDMVTIESKLESQERYWRNKLRLVEEAYSDQLSKLRKEFQFSLEKFVEKNNNNEFDNQNIETTKKIENSFTPDNSSVVVVNYSSSSFNENNSKLMSPEPIRTIKAPVTPENKSKMIMTRRSSGGQETAEWPSNLNLPKKEAEMNRINSSPPKSPTIQHIVPRIVIQKSPIQQMTRTSSLNSKPIAKPRKIPQILMADSQKDEERKQFENQSVIQVQTKHHEYEEPDDILKLDEVTDYSASEVVSSTEEEEEEETKKNENENKKKSRDHGEHKSKITIRMMTEEEAGIERRAKAREECQEELTHELKTLGIEPQETELETKSMTKALKQLKRRRESILVGSPEDERYNKLRERVEKEAKIATLTRSIQEKLDNSRYASPKKGGKSPLVKLVQAVKSSGNNWKRSVKSACKRPMKKERKTSLLKSPSKSLTSKPGLFSRARWRKDKEKNKNIPSYDFQAENKGEFSDDELSSESEMSATSEPEIEKTIFVTKTKHPRKLSTEKINKGQEDEASTDTDSDESDPQRRQSASPHVKKKLKVKNNIASKLRYREGKKKNAALVPAAKEKPLQNNYAKFIATSSTNSNTKENAQSQPSQQRTHENFVENNSTRKSSARRSLESEFNQMTPRKTSTPTKESKVKQEASTELDDSSSSSSWDDQVVQFKKSSSMEPSGEYVKLTPKNTKKINDDKIMTTSRPPDKINYNQRSTPPRRLAMDSWDNDDDDDEDVKKVTENQNTKKPMTFVSQRWETQHPVYENTNEKRRPMSVVTSDAMKIPTTSQNKPPVKEHHPSSLNNSWDSDS